MHEYDIAIVGGGINGAGIAADAAGRGYSVALIEQADLASATSSWSSKLIHGGLRYLEHYEFRLVREALAERSVLLARAPHIIEPLEFILPHHPGLRPRWLLKAGLFLYDHLDIGKQQSNRLAPSSSLNLDSLPDQVLGKQYTAGFRYSDCFVDDSRLVVLNAITAKRHGAQIYTYTKCTQVSHDPQHWTLELQAQTDHQRANQGQTSAPTQVRAKTLVNAAGPWVQQFIEQAIARRSLRNVRLIKGSHILLPQLFDGPQAFILQNADKRVVFVTPYLGMSLVGTTDRPFDGDPAKVVIDDYEIEYLLQTINDYFIKQSQRSDILHTYSGVRPLCDDESDDPQAVTRDYTLTLENQNCPPLLTVYGGKLTTFRKLSEAALTKLQPLLGGDHRPWTAQAPLPGGERSREVNAADLRKQYPWLPDALVLQYVKSLGTLTFDMLGSSQSMQDLGDAITPRLYVREIEYYVRHEFARTAEDILWRRTKLGYTLPDKPESVARVHEQIQQVIAHAQASESTAYSQSFQ